MPWLRQLIAGLSSLGPGFNSKLVRGRFVVQKASSTSDFPRMPRTYLYLNVAVTSRNNGRSLATVK